MDWIRPSDMQNAVDRFSIIAYLDIRIKIRESSSNTGSEYPGATVFRIHTNYMSKNISIRPLEILIPLGRCITYRSSIHVQFLNCIFCLQFY